jgi:aryl-alcohol dehydrogenase-like predicted oxidoreductase
MTELNYTVIERLEDWARQHSQNLGNLAQAWLLSHPEVSSVITGATRLEQVQQNVKAADWELSPGEVEEVNQILRGK